MSEGKTIRGYKLLEEIGRGGMGSIYRALDESVEREVAIKIIQPQYANQPEFILRFEAEARLVARLEHPHIVPLYSYWRDTDGAYLVMRYLRGGSLQDRLRQDEPLSKEAFLQIAVQIGGALDAAHRNGVIHRDIKPSNILLDDDGNAYVSDFGIATGIADNEAVVGTLAYIAPEMLQGNEADARADIYSLGVMFYEMLTGEHPFEDSSPTTMIYQQINNPLPELQERRTDLSDEVDEILQRATAKNPEDRYENVRDLILALQNALGSATLTPSTSFPAVKETSTGTMPPVQPQAPAQAPATSTQLDLPAARSQPMPAPAAARPKRSNRNLLYLGAVVLILLLAAGLWYLLGGGIILESTEGQGVISEQATLLFGVGIVTALGMIGMIYFFNEVRPGTTFTSPHPIEPHYEPAPTVRQPVESAAVAFSNASAGAPGTVERAPTTYHGIAEGDVIDHYELRERLDRGERSRVYHAFDQHMQRDVAMKVINAVASGENRAARFEREAQLLSRLHHAHIVPFFDFGTQDEINYIAMPLLNGGSLRRRMEEQDAPAEPEEVIHWAENIADALDYIHSKNIIHRDLKATNIVFGDQGKAYLVDFGLAKILDTGVTQLTAQGAIIGAPDTIAPEVIQAQAPVPASDQYSFAVLLYEVLTGEPLFKGNSPIALLMQHVNVDPPLASSIRGDLPPAVDVVFKRALAKDAKDRYPTVRAFVNALGEALTVAPTQSNKHIFISYSRTDTEYAFRLADAIRAKGLEVWIDDRINPSDSWWHTIVSAIETCSAFIVIMTPSAEESRWVYRETLLADRKSKPAFPILLDGDIFPLYIGTQCVTVTPESLPPEGYFEGLKAVLDDGS